MLKKWTFVAMTDREEIDNISLPLDLTVYSNEKKPKVKDLVDSSLRNQIEALLVQARKQVVEDVLGVIGDNEYGNIGYDGEEMVNETTDEMLARNDLRATLREEIGKVTNKGE